MTNPIAHPHARVETLLNSIEVERYLRGPLLLVLLDDLAACDARYAAAATAARRLLHRIEAGGVDDGEFVRGVRELRALLAGARAA